MTEPDGTAMPAFVPDEWAHVTDGSVWKINDHKSRPDECIWYFDAIDPNGKVVGWYEWYSRDRPRDGQKVTVTIS